MNPSAQPGLAEPSLDEILRRTQSKLKRVLSRYRIPAQDAEDILQDTFLIMVSKLGTIRNPEAWLVGTLANRCIIYWRRQRTRLFELVDSTILELLAEGEAPVQEQSDLRADLEAMLACLPTRCRSVLRLRYGFGCTTAEVAEQTGYCKSSVRKVTRRCLAALTEQLVSSGFRPGA
jgi:RNA polymerase sigma factor (sigma-70 family)